MKAIRPALRAFCFAFTEIFDGSVRGFFKAVKVATPYAVEVFTGVITDS